MRTFKSMRAEYEKLRARYYMDAESPLRVPPPAEDLRWAWTKDTRRVLAATHLDEDGDPHLIEMPWGAGERVVALMLLHELSHMRNPEADCGRRHRWWREECKRLEAADAFGQAGIF